MLLTAVVSVYLYMARTAKLKGEEINFIDRILHSMFGDAIALYKIEQARQNVLSVRVAANYLNEHLSVADRNKLILSLISLAYHDRSKVHVLGNLEIVELTDLLRLDVGTLDGIYDLFEGKTTAIDLPAALVQDEKSLIKNSMLWAPNAADYKYLGREGRGRLLFIMIESMLLFYNDMTQPEDGCKILEGSIRRHLEPRRFHHLKEGDTLIVPSNSGEITLKTEDLWFLYQLGKNRIELDVSDTESLLYQNQKFYLVCKAKKRQMREIALDEAVGEGKNEIALDLICRRLDADLTLLSSADFYLNRSRSGLSLQNNPEAGALLHFHRQADRYRVKHLDGEIYINRIAFKSEADFCLNQDLISFAGKNYLINRNWELIEIPIQIEEMVVSEISHTFKEGNTALANISFSLPKGSMLAIMGPSGSGKTTLLQVILGDISATNSKISIDGMDLDKHRSFFDKHIGYVPQDDLLFANLTVYENLYYRMRLAMPLLKNPAEIKSRIENLLYSVGLYEQRQMIVGDVMNKKLSGGQRRRLNIALELLLNPTIIVLDEPTSGLSSKDSENIAEFLHELKEQNKIVICTIHQPNATVFSMFDKVLLLERGGIQVFFGDTDTVFGYFDEELEKSGSRKEALKTKLKQMTPDYFFDLIETADAYRNRLFPPIYWQQKYRDYSFRRTLGHEAAEPRPNELADDAGEAIKQKHQFKNNIWLLISRNFLNKSRSRMNLVLTLLVAPLLSLISALVLRSATSFGAAYSFYENANFALFGFISIIVFIFIGLANSVDDILSEKRSIVREIKLNIAAVCQLFSKQLVLFLMTLLQAVLYYFVSAGILGMRGYFFPQVLFFVLSGVIGYNLGLLFSSLIKDRGAVVNILPLVIIPQIMFGGAVIRFADINSKLKLNKAREIPEFCELIPSRWLFEGWVVGSARLNRAEILKRRQQSLIRSAKNNPAEYMEKVDVYNHFLERHPADKYENKSLSTMVNLAHGKSKNEKRNIFLAHHKELCERQVSSTFLAVLMSLGFIALISLGTWLRLAISFKKL